jgi:hypothetical protein
VNVDQPGSRGTNRASSDPQVTSRTTASIASRNGQRLRATRSTIAQIPRFASGILPHPAHIPGHHRLRHAANVARGRGRGRPLRDARIRVHRRVQLVARSRIPSARCRPAGIRIHRPPVPAPVPRRGCTLHQRRVDDAAAPQHQTRARSSRSTSANNASASPRFASGSLPPSYTTTGDVTPLSTLSPQNPPPATVRERFVCTLSSQGGTRSAGTGRGGPSSTVRRWNTEGGEKSVNGGAGFSVRTATSR